MSAEKALALRFLAGHELAAARSLASVSNVPLSPVESFEKAMELRDLAMSVAPPSAELIAARAREDERVRAVWVRLKAAYR